MPAWSRISCRWPWPLPIAAARNLSDQGEHGRVHSVGGQQRRAGVKQTRSWNDRIGLRLARCQCRAQGHVGRSLLMTGVDDAQAVAGSVKGIKEVIVVDSGQRIDGVESMSDEGRNRRFRGRHFHTDDLGLLFGLGIEACRRPSLHAQCAESRQPCRAASFVRVAGGLP